MLSGTYQPGLLSIFYAIGSKPLELWGEDGASGARRKGEHGRKENEEAKKEEGKKGMEEERRFLTCAFATSFCSDRGHD